MKKDGGFGTNSQDPVAQRVQTLLHATCHMQGWRSGESAHLPPMCPGFYSRTRRHMWVGFVVGSLLCSEKFFSGYSAFPSL